MADENTLLILDALDKIGYSGEAAGTGDVFQYLAQLLASLGLTTDAANSNGDALQRLAYLVAALGSPSSGTIASALGLVGDTANPAGSANAKLVDIKSYLVSTIDSYLAGTMAIPGLGQQGDGASSTGSANAKLAYLENYLSGSMLPYLNGTTAIPGLGQQGDGASSTGTANAKLQYLIANLLGVEPAVVIGRTCSAGNFSTTSSSLVNALSISGMGSLVSFMVTITAQTSGEVKITIDGTVLVDTTTSFSVGTYYLINLGTGLAIGYLNSGFGVMSGSLDFKSSLLIQIKADGTHPLQCEYVYNK